jgi:hypothetical protein
MKTFHFRADCKFQALDIDDAFRLLAEHFERLERICSGDEGSETDLLDWGTMKIAAEVTEGIAGTDDVAIKEFKIQDAPSSEK